MANYALLAIDDQMIAEKLREAAKNLRVAVALARNADEAIRLADAQPPSVIFLELLSQRHRPLTLIRTVRKDTHPAHAARLVGFVPGQKSDIRRKAHSLGCDYVYSRAELARAAESILRQLLS